MTLTPCEPVLPVAKLGAADNLCFFICGLLDHVHTELRPTFFRPLSPVSGNGAQFNV
jgi:hypothetical protein